MSGGGWKVPGIMNGPLFHAGVYGVGSWGTREPPVLSRILSFTVSIYIWHILEDGLGQQLGLLGLMFWHSYCGFWGRSGYLLVHSHKTRPRLMGFQSRWGFWWLSSLPLNKNGPFYHKGAMLPAQWYAPSVVLASSKYSEPVAQILMPGFGWGCQSSSTYLLSCSSKL